MRLQWFEVQGYKNLTAPVRLDDLGRFNVLHGDNNVGKSNILESIGLLFVALRALRDEAGGRAEPVEVHARSAPASSWRTAYRTRKYFANRRFDVDDIFHVVTGAPIKLAAHLALDAEDGSSGNELGETIEVAVRLERREDGANITLERIQTGGSDDVGPGTEGKAAALRVLDRLSPRPSGKTTEPRFALIRADRTMIAEPPIDDTAALAARDGLTPPLALALYEAEGSRGPARDRFDRFLAALEQARGLVGEGRWKMRFNVREGRADLALEQEREGGGYLMPIGLMGSGVQQLATIAGELTMAGAAVVAIEEPELNLRWATQHKLREMMRALVGAPGGPAQLFVTSHAAAFEFEEAFYAVTAGPKGPEVQRRPKSEAPQLVEPEVQRPPTGARAPLSYVTSDGLVRVPDHVLEALGLRHGGGVVFVTGKDGHIRVLTNEQFVDLFEPREADR